MSAENSSSSRASENSLQRVQSANARASSVDEVTGAAMNVSGAATATSTTNTEAKNAAATTTTTTTTTPAAAADAVTDADALEVARTQSYVAAVGSTSGSDVAQHTAVESHTVAGAGSNTNSASGVAVDADVVTAAHSVTRGGSAGGIMTAANGVREKRRPVRVSFAETSGATSCPSLDGQSEGNKCDTKAHATNEPPTHTLGSGATKTTTTANDDDDDDNDHDHEDEGENEADKLLWADAAAGPPGPPSPPAPCCAKPFYVRWDQCPHAAAWISSPPPLPQLPALSQM
jgi:hypothetical protein